MPKQASDVLVEEVRSVKMLLILQLLMQGAKQSDVARMLGTSEATVSRLIPKEVKLSLKGINNG